MCHVTSTLTNQRRVFKACLTQTERVSDDVKRKIGPLDMVLSFKVEKTLESKQNTFKCTSSNFGDEKCFFLQNILLPVKIIL